MWIRKMFWLALCSVTVGLDGSTIESPSFCGEVTGGVRWLYLKSTATDGDWETGTKITLTRHPANLHAVLQRLDPAWKSAYRAYAAYGIGSTNCDLNLSYLHANPSDRHKVDRLHANQFIQNFLGGSYTSLHANGAQNVNDVGFSVGLNYLVDYRLKLRPYVGLEYAAISRNLHVHYNGLYVGHQQGSLQGHEKCRYWGVGPTLGVDFSYDFSRCLRLEGRVAGGALIGKNSGHVDAEAVEGRQHSSFDSHHTHHRATAMIENAIALAYRPLFCFYGYGMEIKLGYQANYYFKVLDRIDPYNGFVVNPQPVPIHTAANLGFAAPFIELSLIPAADPGDEQEERGAVERERTGYGGYAAITGSWLNAKANNNDGVYATLTREGRKPKEKKNTFDYSLNALYTLGYRTCGDLDVKLQYFRYCEDSHAHVEAGYEESISSVDASGPSYVAFKGATSKAVYALNQGDLLLEKAFSPFCRVDFLLSLGLRYADLKRTFHRNYTGGEPSAVTHSKHNRLKSHYVGVGPVAGIEMNFAFTERFSLVGSGTLACLMGHQRASLDQENKGSAGKTSNTLRNPWTDYLVPVLEAEIGLSYGYAFSCGFDVALELGYQFKEYFRAINLVYPTLLTGLEQRSSDLKLYGPYVRLTANF